MKLRVLDPLWRICIFLQALGTEAVIVFLLQLFQVFGWYFIIKTPAARGMKTFEFLAALRTDLNSWISRFIHINHHLKG